MFRNRCNPPYPMVVQDMKIVKDCNNDEHVELKVDYKWWPETCLMSYQEWLKKGWNDEGKDI